MKAIGLNFTKISAEKFEGKISAIETDIKFLDIEKKEIDILEEEVLSISFTFSVFYIKEKKEKVAAVDFHGNALLSVSKDESKEVLKSWKKKEMSQIVKTFLINLIIKKCTIKALDLEEQLNLPPHLPFPRVKPQEEKKED